MKQVLFVGRNRRRGRMGLPLLNLPGPVLDMRANGPLAHDGNRSAREISFEQLCAKFRSGDIEDDDFGSGQSYDRVPLRGTESIREVSNGLLEFGEGWDELVAADEAGRQLYRNVFLDLAVANTQNHLLGYLTTRPRSLSAVSEAPHE